MIVPPPVGRQEEAETRRLFPGTPGLAFDPHLRRILQAAGWTLRPGLPGPGDRVAVWGATPKARLAGRVARWRGAGLVTLEDAFLRSVHPGRARNAARARGPLGLLLDTAGQHFDCSRPSQLERLLQEAPLDEPGLLARAQDGMARLRWLGLSKYNDGDPDCAPPEPGYVLIIDQVAGDASIALGGASDRSFAGMLARARAEHPNARIVIRTHPETAAGGRPGHFTPRDGDARTLLLTDPVLPHRLLDGAIAVYAVTSLLGYEAILAGHRPVLFGLPFYAGWGLSDDRVTPPARRDRRLRPEQMFIASHLLAPIWFDPCRLRQCSFEEAVDQLEAETRAFREDRNGHVALGMRRWKHATLRRFFGQEKRLRFTKTPARAASLAIREGSGLLLWGTGEAPMPPPGGASATLRRVEDGFLRSRGLGAALTEPLSLIADGRGLHYDPAQPSDLEILIGTPPPPGGAERAGRLIAAIRAAGVTKYNLPGSPPPPPTGTGSLILVPGQVADDASLRRGGGTVRDNLALLALTRRMNPEATILYKPHPDVEAGLRPGRIDATEARRHADRIVQDIDMSSLLEIVDEVWTMTSLTGFEALLRGKRVTVTGTPFYAGWGLTRDLAPAPARRNARPDLAALVHAALIAYPRYVDPVSGLPCPAEVALDRLSAATLPTAPPIPRIARALQLLRGQILRSRVLRSRVLETLAQLRSQR